MYKSTRFRCSRRRLAWMWILAIVVSAFVAAPIAWAHKLPKVSPELEKVRAKLKKYKHPYRAVRDGYFSTVACVEFAEGGMGVHFFNPRLIGPVPDPMSPPILLYAPRGGRLRLVAVEWLVPLATGVKERPRLFGQPFKGPMEGHEPLLPKKLHHYDFHVWLFDENPAGLFNGTNPRVKCKGRWPYSLMEKHPATVKHK